MEKYPKKHLKHKKDIYTFVDEETGEVLHSETIITGVEEAQPPSDVFRKYRPSLDYYHMTKPMMQVYFYVMNHIPRGGDIIKMSPGAVVAETLLNHSTQFHNGVRGLVKMGFMAPLERGSWRVNRKYASHGR